MSFGWLGTFRIGQWTDFRKFVLNERRDVDSAVQVIDAELKRIGDIIVVYEKTTEKRPTPSGNESEVTIVSEKRKAFYVTKNSSLEKLLKAYVAQGGNPLDISMFLKPDSALLVGNLEDQDPDEDSMNMTGIERIYPHDGIVAPETPAMFNPSGGVYEGGFLTWGKYPWRQLQGRFPAGDRNAGLASRVDHARRWCQQAIYEKRNNIEARIIKLMDLREQLILERDQILAQAVGGTTIGNRDLPDPEMYHPDFHVANIVSDIDSVIFKEVESGGVNPNEKSETRFDYDTILEDTPDDDNTAL